MGGSNLVLFITMCCRSRVNEHHSNERWTVCNGEYVLIIPRSTENALSNFPKKTKLQQKENAGRCTRANFFVSTRPSNLSRKHEWYKQMNPYSITARNFLSGEKAKQLLTSLRAGKESQLHSIQVVDTPSGIVMFNLTALDAICRQEGRRCGHSRRVWIFLSSALQTPCRITFSVSQRVWQQAESLRSPITE